MIFRIIIVFGCCAIGAISQAQTKQDCDSVIYLKNQIASFGIQAFGGAVTDFRLKEKDINPFTWKLSSSDMPPNNKEGAPFRGHFLCLGRWGAPTEGEVKAGIPHNGQSGNGCWQVEKTVDPLHLVMLSSAPADGIKVIRKVFMDKQAPVVKISEEVQSVASFIRPFNMVQHVTIGPPFLDTSMMVDCNAGKGFLQSMSYPDPHRFDYSWPNGIRDSAGTALDLTKSDIKFSYVSTHLVKDSLGWVAAYHPAKGMLVAYIWQTSDYPWINIWQQWQQDNLWAKGLEFGSTGIGRSYQDLIMTDTRFYGVPSFLLLDAGEKIEKDYLCFLMTIPPDFKGVQSIHVENGNIALVEKGNRGRKFHTQTSLSLK